MPSTCVPPFILPRQACSLPPNAGPPLKARPVWRCKQPSQPFPSPACPSPAPAGAAEGRGGGQPGGRAHEAEDAGDREAVFSGGCSGEAGSEGMGGAQPGLQCRYTRGAVGSAAQERGDAWLHGIWAGHPGRAQVMPACSAWCVARACRPQVPTAAPTHRRCPAAGPRRQGQQEGQGVAQREVQGGEEGAQAGRAHAQGPARPGRRQEARQEGRAAGAGREEERAQAGEEPAALSATLRGSWLVLCSVDVLSMLPLLAWHPGGAGAMCPPLVPSDVLLHSLSWRCLPPCALHWPAHPVTYKQKLGLRARAARGMEGTL